METDSGLACLVLLLQFHLIPADANQLQHALGKAAPAIQDQAFTFGQSLKDRDFVSLSVSRTF